MIDLTDTTDVIAAPTVREQARAIQPIELVEQRQSFGEAKLIGFLPVADDTEMGLFTAVANFFGRMETSAASAD